MKIEHLILAKDIISDARTNNLSIINIIERLEVPAAPLELIFAIQGVGVFVREEGEIGELSRTYMLKSRRSDSEFSSEATINVKMAPEYDRVRVLIDLTVSVKSNDGTIYFTLQRDDGKYKRETSVRLLVGEILTIAPLVP